MKKWLLVCVVLLSGCGSSKAEFKELSAAEAKSKMNDDVVVLDVRTVEEYNSGHIEDAVNIPLDNLEEIKTQVQNKDIEILVYCRSGNRSAKASAQLIEMGYSNIYDFGGIQDWPYEIIK